MVDVLTVTPILSVRDVDESLAYYVDKLGFADPWCWGEPSEFGGVRAGACEIFFCRDHQGQPGTWIAINVGDVDALFADLSQRGADVRQPPTNFEWGMREMNVRDPDGHRIRFGTPTDAQADGVPFVPE
jgi:catechol 2,3-dioxygenase-like lactoylglutathione lyase family enzyme